MEQLRRVTRRLTRSTSTDDAVAILDGEVAEMAAADRVAVVLLDVREPPRPCHVSGDGTWRDLDLDVGPALRQFVEPLFDGEQLLLRDTMPVAGAVMAAAVGVAARSALCLPLVTDDGLIGAVVVAWTHTTRTVDGALAQALGATADEAATVLSHHLRAERAEEAANTDPLTGVRNRRALEDALRDLCPGDAVLVIDVDHFKAVNDQRGHAAGDQVLRGLAACLASNVRSSDVVARLGGDEFVVILREAEISGCRKVADAVRRAWHEADGGATISLGACANEGEPGAVTLSRADAALYDAKSAGRNRDAFHGDKPSSPPFEVFAPRDR
jgi:diguanylate cyclase (GGDEF)-like protein